MKTPKRPSKRPSIFDLAAGLAKRDPRLTALLDAVMQEYDDGRVTGLADSEVDALVDAAFRVPVA